MTNMDRLPRLAILAAALVAITTLSVGAQATHGDIHVPEDETLMVGADGLHAQRDLIIDGTVQGEPDADLILSAGQDIVISGDVLAAHGAPGQDGASVHLTADNVKIGEDATVQAGAGGHGEPDIQPDAQAIGQHGGEGGSVTISALTLGTDGALLVGAGGKGGDALGATAIGGDGGDMGRLIVNDAPQEPSDGASHPTLPTVLVPPSQPQSHCGHPLETDAGSPGSTGAGGGNGGDAFACGQNADDGTDGLDGKDDSYGWGDKKACTMTAYTSANIKTYNDQKRKFKNGMNGGPGLDAVLDGGNAQATGGTGGDSTSANHAAGNGGDAEAQGGNGGAGGDGGDGGDGKRIQGCDGGDGGDGSNGGNAGAIAGAPGSNPLDCTKNGAPGQATATAGNKGARGVGGDGGAVSGNSPGSDGRNGNSGAHGSATTVPANSLPCTVDFSAPIVTGQSLHPSSIQLSITDQTASDPTTAPVTAFEIHRNRTNGDTSEHTTWTIPPGDTNPTLTVDDKLRPNTQYWYEVRTVTDLGKGAFSPPIAITTMQQPEPFQPEVTATPQTPDHDILVDIKKPSPITTNDPSTESNDLSQGATQGHQDPVDEFEVFSTSVPVTGSCPSVSDLTHLVTVDSDPPLIAQNFKAITFASHLDEDRAPNTKYCYAARAVTFDAFGDPVKGPFSDVASAVLPQGNGLEAPTLLASTTSSSSIQLTVADPASGPTPVEFALYRAGPFLSPTDCPTPSSFDHLADEARAIPPPTTHDDTGLEQASTYCYLARAVDNQGEEGPRSNIATASIPPLMNDGGPLTPFAPDKQHNLHARPGGDEGTVELTLRINPAPGSVTGIEIHRASMAESDGACINPWEKTWQIPPSEGSIEATHPGGHVVTFTDAEFGQEHDQAQAGLEVGPDGSFASSVNFGMNAVDEDPMYCYKADVFHGDAQPPTESNEAYASPSSFPKGACVGIGPAPGVCEKAPSFSGEIRCEAAHAGPPCIVAETGDSVAYTLRIDTTGPTDPQTVTVQAPEGYTILTAQGPQGRPGLVLEDGEEARFVTLGPSSPASDGSTFHFDVLPPPKGEFIDEWPVWANDQRVRPSAALSLTTAIDTEPPTVDTGLVDEESRFVSRTVEAYVTVEDGVWARQVTVSIHDGNGDEWLEALSLESGEPFDPSLEGTSLIDTAVLPDGDYVLVAEAVDAAGNLATAESSFTVDNTPTSVELWVSTHEIDAGDHIDIRADANDGGAGIDRARIDVRHLDGQNKEVLLDKTYDSKEDILESARWTTDSRTPTGTYEIRWLVWDAAGNQAKATEIVEVH